MCFILEEFMILSRWKMHSEKFKDIFFKRFLVENAK